MSNTNLKSNSLEGYTIQLPPFNMTKVSISEFQKPGKSLEAMFEDSLSIFSKDTRSSSSLDTITDSDAISTHSSENVDDSVTILNSTLNEKKKNTTDETKYKTEMCKNWSESGQCPYGKKCKFAHGKKELNEKKVLNKACYKTKKCNSFHNKMVCMYGVRCLFAHEARPFQDISKKCYYHKFISCPSLLLQAEISKKSRLPIFASKTEGNPQTEMLSKGFGFQNEKEEFDYYLDSFKAQNYFMFGFEM